MNILTISASPYLLTRNGRINMDLIMGLTASGHRVESLVWHHDIEFFLPLEMSEHYFEYAGEKVCKLYPFLGEKGQMPAFTFATMKASQPNVVISIGNYEEIAFISGIKSLYPHLFKWIAIITAGGGPINENYREQLDYADHIICTNKSSYKSVSDLLTKTVEYLPFGADFSYFSPIEDVLEEEFTVLNCGKNSQVSNIAAFFKALGLAVGVKGTLHTNLIDGGEYDIPLLVKRYGLKDKLTLPLKFASVREGIDDESLNILYNRHHAVVDCSTQSPTALSLLEAMATGCLPIGPAYGAVGDVIEMMPKEYRFFVPYEIYIGTREEEYAVVSATVLSEIMERIGNRYRQDKGWLKSGRQETIKISGLFGREIFISKVNEIVQNIVLTESTIVVDSLV